MNSNQELQIRKAINQWVKDFVSKPTENLNGFSPCPFAKDSLDKNQVLILVNDGPSIENCLEKITEAADEIIHGQYEVAIIAHTHYESWHPDKVSKFVLSWREQYKDKDLYLLKDHPLAPEIVSGLKMNQGEYLLFFVQKRSTLLEARKKLWNQGYYESWSAQERERVFGSIKLDE
jgi:hypothetical protein